MDCKEADAYMMKFMDNLYTPEETSLFNQHLKSCSSCRESFAVYQEMMEVFVDAELHEAPEGLKCNIMEEVYRSSKISSDLKLYMEKKLYGFIGVFLILIGTSTAMYINRDIISSIYISARPETILTSKLIIFSGIFIQAISYFWNFSIMGVGLVFDFVVKYRIVILFMSITFFCVSILMDRKSKEKNNALTQELEKS